MRLFIFTCASFLWFTASKEMEYLSLSLGVSEGDVVRQARAFYEVC